MDVVMKVMKEAAMAKKANAELAQARKALAAALAKTKAPSASAWS